MQRVLRAIALMFLMPVIGRASDPMDTSDGVGGIRRSKKQRAPRVTNAAEPTVYGPSPIPSFVILRSVDNPMRCAFVLSAQKKRQLALVPWANFKSAKSGFKIMQSSYNKQTSLFMGLLNEPTYCVTGFCTSNPEDNLYADFNQGLEALWAQTRILDRIQVQERDTTQTPRAPQMVTVAHLRNSH